MQLCTLEKPEDMSENQIYFYYRTPIGVFDNVLFYSAVTVQYSCNHSSLFLRLDTLPPGGEIFNTLKIFFFLF